MKQVVFLAPLVAVLALSGTRVAATDRDTFITLGTHGGPVPDAKRFEPANALVVDGAVYLVEAGDGAADQLARAGLSLQALKAVFISHLHFDHTGGLFAVLGLRHQTGASGKLKIYGPPGIKETVNGLLAAIRPGAVSGYGIPGEEIIPPENTVQVIEIRDGAQLSLDGFTVTAAENTHYSFPPGSDMDKRFDSLSFRFNLPDRSIVYTGDTGPSDAVTALAKGADILVSELIDGQLASSMVPPTEGTDADKKRFQVMKQHLGTHHVTPEQVGKMASEAKVGRVVITHLVPSRRPGVATESYVAEIRQWYSGAVEIADDLNRY
jgi:ribonuclease BN (tRNA processing enzyme)